MPASYVEYLAQFSTKKQYNLRRQERVLRERGAGKLELRRWEVPEDVPNLYFVGAGTHPGAGMPGVLSSAKVVDRLIPDSNGTGNARDPIAGSHAA